MTAVSEERGGVALGDERPCDVLVRVAAMTRPKSGMDLGGLPRKMPRIQAILAAACVTAIGARLGVSPAQACIEAGLRSSANNCYDFHLSAAEAASPRTVERDKPLNGTLDNYRAIVVAMARMAAEAGRPVPVDDLLGELASAVREYLVRFVPRLSRSDHDEAGEALAALGGFLSRQRRNRDGVPVDLPAYWRACRASGLAYHPGRRTMVPASDAPFGANWPAVPLGWRWAGGSAVSCIDVSGAALGSVPAEMVYDIRLAACPGKGGGVEMRFLLEAWTALPVGPRGAAAGQGPEPDPWFYRPAVTARGFPFGPVRAYERRLGFDMVLDRPVEGAPQGFEAGVSGAPPASAIGDVALAATAAGCRVAMGGGLRGSPTDGILDMPRGWAGHGDSIDGCATVRGLCERLYRSGPDAVDALILARASAMVDALASHAEADGREAFLRRMRG